MRLVLMYTLCSFLVIQADTLPEKLLFLKTSELKKTLKIERAQKSEQEKTQDQLKDAVKKPIQGITLEVFETNVTKDTRISVDYAPTYKQGSLIDNEEKTTVKLIYRF